MTTVVDQTWFVPLPKQRTFMLTDARESVYAGGFGSGKTLCGGFRALRAAMQHPGTVGLVARQTSGALAANTQKVLLEGDDKPPIIPPELVAERSEKHGTTIRLHNDSEILFRSFQDWNDMKLLGPNYGFVYIDELTECTQKVWLAFLSRLRHPAGPEQAWGTTNPNGHDWVWQRFHPDSGQAEPGALLVHAPSEENTHLSESYLRWLRSQPAEWQKRYVDANFDTAAGQIWDEWNRHVHVAPAFEVPHQWPRFESLDHGRRNPTAVLWLAIDPEDNLVVFDGYYSPGLVSQHAAAITVTRGERRYGPIFADPQVFVRGSKGECVADEYREHGITLVPAPNDVAAGLLRVSEWLTRRPNETFPDWHPYAGTHGPDGLGAPRLYVLDTPGTTDLRREIPQYRWRDLSPSQEEKTDQPEEPRKKDDHACFVAGTLVATVEGDRPIETVRVGDLVLTRQGPRPVVAACSTGVRPVMTVQLDDGSELTGTADHPVWAGRWCRLGALRYGDICATRAASGRVIEQRAGSGRRPTGRFLPAITSIISMAIRSTTISATSPSSPRPSISALTGLCLRLRGWLRSTLPAPSLLLGTAPSVAAPGIASMRLPSGHESSRPSTRASSAAQPSSRGSSTTSVSARTGASRRGGVLPAWTTRIVSARSAARRSGSIVTASRGPALDAARVVSSRRRSGRAEVFNLTVAEAHEYFANGVLVSNCDALRYGVMTRPRPTPPAPDTRARREPAVAAGLRSRSF